MNISDTFEIVDIDSIHPDAENARVHSEQQLQSLAASLKRFGMQKPIVVTADNTIIAGNGTYEAAKDVLGWKRIAIIRSPLDEKEARAFSIADNQISELSEWDLDSLSKHMSDMASWDSTQDWSAIGFMDDIIDPLVEDSSSSEEFENAFHEYMDNKEKSASASDKDVIMAKPIKVTEEQWEVIDQAITMIKLATGDLKIKPGRAIELICGDFLSGAEQLPVESEDISS